MDDWVQLVTPQEAATAKTPGDNGATDAGDGSAGIETGATGFSPAAPRPPAPPQPAPPAAQRGDDSVRMARSFHFRRSILLVLALVTLLWAVEGLDALTPSATSDVYGIQPRSVDGLRNILFAPFLHAGFGHLSANSVPLIVLGLLVMLSGLQPFVIVSLTAALASGLGVWLFGAGNTVHLGASGIIFGYLGFLLAAAWFLRSVGAIVVALAVVLIYGSTLWGVLPGQEGVSWLGHLFGLAGGILAAWLLRKKPGAT